MATWDAHEARGGACLSPAGFIFCCSSATQGECLERLLLGSPRGEWRKVEAVGRRTALFLWNFQTRCLQGVFWPSAPPALDIVSGAWASSGKQFPAQVRVRRGSSKVTALSKAQLGETAVDVRGGPVSTAAVKQLLRLFGSASVPSAVPTASSAAAGGGGGAAAAAAAAAAAQPSTGADDGWDVVATKAAATNQPRPASSARKDAVATMYDTDYRAMLEAFKVKLCARRDKHDRSSCPNFHQSAGGSEQVMRRRCPFPVDPSTRRLVVDGSRWTYDTQRKLPPAEFLYHPEQYKRKPCEEFGRGGRCSKGAICAFRHLHAGVDYDAEYTSANARFPWAPGGSAAAVAAGTATIAAARKAALDEAAALKQAKAAAVKKQADVRRAADAKRAAEAQSAADAKRAKAAADAKVRADAKEALHAQRMEEGRQKAAARRAKKEAADAKKALQAKNAAARRVEKLTGAKTAMATAAPAPKQEAIAAEEDKKKGATPEPEVGYDGAQNTEGQHHGHGACRWPDGSWYKGEWKCGAQHGPGTMQWEKEGIRHEGNWKQGKPCGEGKRTGPNDDYFEGQWKDGARWAGQGIQKIQTSPTVTFTGRWEAGLFDGPGTLLSEGGVNYEGQFKSGKMTGRGIRTLANGDKFEGQFKDGVVNGDGTSHRGDGSAVYNGQFKNGVFHGQGIIDEFETRYEGEWHEGQRHGHGAEQTISGSSEAEFLEQIMGQVLAGRNISPEAAKRMAAEREDSARNSYVGQFEGNERSGSGIYTWARGDVYNGQWVAGEMEGRGKLTTNLRTLAGGSIGQGVYDGRFKDGFKHDHQVIASSRHARSTMCTFGKILLCSLLVISQLCACVPPCFLSRPSALMRVAISTKADSATDTARVPELLHAVWTYPRGPVNGRRIIHVLTVLLARGGGLMDWNGAAKVRYMTISCACLRGHVLRRPSHWLEPTKQAGRWPRSSC